MANIMLVSVTSRTREIGIRKAIGATRWVIRMQFLIESIMRAGLGGLGGVAVGVVIHLGRKGDHPAGRADFPTAGDLAGGYPARRASRLQPIEALRFELAPASSRPQLRVDRSFEWWAESPSRAAVGL